METLKEVPYAQLRQRGFEALKKLDAIKCEGIVARVMIMPEFQKNLALNGSVTMLLGNHQWSLGLRADTVRKDKIHDGVLLLDKMSQQWSMIAESARHFPHLRTMLSIAEEDENVFLQALVGILELATKIELRTIPGKCVYYENR